MDDRAMNDREWDMWGPGIVLQPANFGGARENMSDGADRFAERQDAIHRLNIGLAAADADANELLSIVPRSADYDFSAEMEKLFRRRRGEVLKELRHPADRSEAVRDFEELMRRYMGRVEEMSLDSRVRSRVAGAEQVLQRIKAAAVADPDRLSDRLMDADMLLGRMVESGVDAGAAAVRAGQFRGEVGSAILDDLAERDPAGAIARLDSGLFDGMVSAEDKLPLREDFVRIADADAKAWRRRAVFAEQAMQFDTAARRRSVVAALSSALRSHEADEGAIERAFYHGEIDADDASDLRARLDQFDEERRMRGVEIDHLDTAIKSGFAPRSDRPWSQDIVDAWWQSEQARATASSALVPGCFGVTGFIPTSYIDDVRGKILSGMPDDAVVAGQAFRALRDGSPAAADAILAELPDRERRALALTADYAHLDLPPERISELVETRLADASGEPPRDATPADEDAAASEQKDQVGDEEQLVMGLAKPALRVLRAIDAARRKGQKLRDQLRDANGKEEGRVRPPDPVKPEAVISAFKTALEALNEQRQAEGKSDVHKVELTPDQFRPGASAEDAIEGLAETVFSEHDKEFRGRDVIQIDLGEVDNDFAARVKADTGIDLAGYKHSIDSAQVAHAFEGHGPEREKDPTQEPISPEAVSTYLDVVKNYDRVTARSPARGAGSLTFEKDINGTTFVVEQVRSGQDRLAFYSMWIKRR